MRRLSVAPMLAGLVALAAWATPAAAQSAEADGWHSGFCLKGEGLAIVIDFRDADDGQGPTSTGSDVRCLFGPQVTTLDLSNPESDGFRSVPGLAGVSITGDFAYYGLAGETRASTGRIGSGWSFSGFSDRNNIDRFIGFTYSEGGGTTPILEPRFESAGGGSEQTPPPGEPSTGGGGGTPDRVDGGTPDRVGGGTPDRVGSPERAGAPEQSADPDDPDARAPGGEARSESAEETPEPTETPESDQALTGSSESQELGSTDSLTGGPMWLWITVIALVGVVYLAVTVLVLRARKAARLAADS